MEWVLQYLTIIAKVDLVYSKASTNSGSVVQFVHLEYARDLGKRRSLIIYVFTLSDYTIKKIYKYSN